jgi:hypothetical protein
MRTRYHQEKQAISYVRGSSLNVFGDGIIQGHSRRSIHFEKFILPKLLTLNPVLCTDGKEISQSSDIDDLKRRITEAVAAVTCDML